MARKKYRGISISTIMMFLGGVAILGALFFPIMSNPNKTQINVLNADSQLALAVSEYLLAKNSDEEVRMLQDADKQLQNRLTYNKAIPLSLDDKKLTLSDKANAKENAKTILFSALNEICDYYSLELQDMKNSQTIGEFMHLVVNTTNKPNIINYLKIYNFIADHPENFLKETQQKTNFKRWVLAGIIALAIILVGAAFLFTFRYTNVLFLALTLLCLILVCLMFYQISMMHFGKLDVGGFNAYGTLIFLGGGLLLLISAISGINSDNWLVAIIVYLIVIALVGIMIFFFKDSFGVIWFNTGTS